MSNKKRHFSNVLIDPPFQIKLLSYFVFLFMISTISLYSAIYLFFHKLENKALSVGIPPGHVFFKFIGNEKADMDLMFLGLVLFNLILLLGVGFFISHRIAGPLFKLKRYLSDEIKAEAPDFQLRKNDFIQDIVPVVNSLKSRVRD